MRLTFSEIKNKIRKIIPEGIDSDVDLEAGSISVITKEPASFGGAGGQSLTVKIAKAVRRRVVIRPHPDLLSSENEGNDAVSRIMPEEALIRRIWLDPALSEVTIEADDPKSAVGQKGTNIQQLRNEIGWLVNVLLSTFAFLSCSLWLTFIWWDFNSKSSPVRLGVSCV